MQMCVLENGLIQIGKKQGGRIVKKQSWGMWNLELGDTLTADIVQKNGNIATSAIDHHIYVSTKSKDEVLLKKLDNSSTDHLPIILLLFKNCVCVLHLHYNTNFWPYYYHFSQL